MKRKTQLTALMVLATSITFAQDHNAKKVREASDSAGKVEIETIENVNVNKVGEPDYNYKELREADDNAMGQGLIKSNVSLDKVGEPDYNYKELREANDNAMGQGQIQNNDHLDKVGEPDYNYKELREADDNAMGQGQIQNNDHLDKVGEPDYNYKELREANDNAMGQGQFENSMDENKAYNNIKLKIYPNPMPTNGTSIRIIGMPMTPKKITVGLYTVYGDFKSEEVFISKDSFLDIKFAPSTRLDPGLYYFKFVIDRKVIVEKILVEL